MSIIIYDKKLLGNKDFSYRLAKDYENLSVPFYISKDGNIICNLGLEKKDLFNTLNSLLNLNPIIITEIKENKVSTIINNISKKEQITKETLLEESNKLNKTELNDLLTR